MTERQLLGEGRDRYGAKWIWERKYEIDSLCYPLQFSYLFWKNTGRTDQFDEVFWEGVDKILTVFETEMNHEEKSPYSFIRKTAPTPIRFPAMEKVRR